MQRKSFGDMQCPIARSLERVGEWWSILILRDAFHGLTRFDEFQKSLDIAPNILTRRLAALVESGLLERRRYSERPPRDEYILTDLGRDFRPVMQALLGWGNRHFAPEGLSVVYEDTDTGTIAEPVMVDRLSGQPMNDARFQLTAGPAAGARVQARIEAAAKRRAQAQAQASRQAAPLRGMTASGRRGRRAGQI
ncbi:helix-turn-helix domain-containing protein [Acidisoma sp. L85]|jgi:DNA-binding HxlR family transcriptional regulator|uniref:winged helix-turn-helix transcriptional regulator n=1 Tax=Acidisoma sp. L85 TaxID=1641850 RepID=UPI00131B58AF|nr:helix-turn-helix domain-containing protein [Acidisoma sp. L85]